MMAIPLILFVPLLAAGLTALPLSPGVRRALGLGSCTVVLGLALELAVRVAGTGRVSGPGELLACEGLGALLVVLIAAVAWCAALFGWGYLGRERGGDGGAYHPLFHLFVLSMLAVVLAENLSLLWTSVAMTTLFSAFLVAWNDTAEALEAAWKYVVLTTLGAVLALFGLLLLHWAARGAGGDAATWSGLAAAAPRAPRALLGAGFALVALGFGTKAGLAPMHTWLPDAHSQAPAPVCALLSGVETSTALYVILRLAGVLERAGLPEVREWMLGAGLVSVAIAALLLVGVRDLKRMFAYSTVEHMGIVLAAAGLGAGAGFGVSFQIGAHALAKSLCFLAAGSVVLATGTQRIAAVRGLLRRAPLAGGALLAGALAVAGAPPAAVFLSEVSIVRAGLAAQHHAAVAALVALVVIAFCAMLRHVHAMTFGEPAEAAATVALPTSCRAALWIAVLPLVAFGLWLPDPVAALLGMAARSLAG